MHALVGENGAGKSTLIKILTGALEPDGGEILLRGERILDNSPAKARALGISVIYQQPALFPDLSVAENIALAGESGSPWHKVDWRARREHAAELLARVGARVSPDVRAANLSMPEQQMVEIAKALDANAQVLIMDEPTASLGDQDAANLFRLVKELRAKGTAIVYISHRFEELFLLADRVTVLRDGVSIQTCAMTEVTNADLIRLMVGRELDTVFPKHQTTLGETVFEVRDLSCSRLGVKNASLTIRQRRDSGFGGFDRFRAHAIGGSAVRLGSARWWRGLARWPTLGHTVAGRRGACGHRLRAGGPAAPWRHSRPIHCGEQHAGESRQNLRCQWLSQSQ